METQNSISEISNLIGTWKGNGIAKFPTIKPAEYVEKLVFTTNYDFPVLHYEQKTWIKGKSGLFDKSIFWETGFIIKKEDNTYELCNVQKGGRVEVLSGKILNEKKRGFDLSFKSKIIANDENMIKSGREFQISKNILKYELWMSTKQNENYEIHLNAVLEKIKPIF